MAAIANFRRDLRFWCAGILLTCVAYGWFIGGMVDDLHREDTALYVLLTIAAITVPSSGALGVSYLLLRFIPQIRAFTFWPVYALVLAMIVLLIWLPMYLLNADEHGSYSPALMVVAVTLLQFIPIRFSYWVAEEIMGPVRHAQSALDEHNSP